MLSLLKKEISSFFGSITGYLVVFVFLLSTGLFLWIFPGNYNIPEGAYASLDGLFDLAPWVYLFLVPAITMRMFAEEKRQGTMEVLLTRPLSAFQIVWAKYLAGLVLVTISLLPTFIWFYAVYALGSPVGNMDIGGTWGAYIGLFFLAAIYIAIGLLASALTDNQVLAFILALFISFTAYVGFSLFGSLGLPASIQQFIIGIGIEQHYQSISRGVVDSRDLIYFLIAVFLLLLISTYLIRFQTLCFRYEIKKISLIILALAGLGFVSGKWFYRIDLTAEKRYSISSVSKDLVQSLDKPINITLYLAGDLPPGFRKLQQAIVEKIADYNSFASQPIFLNIFDPYQISDKDKRNKLLTDLIDKGIQPTDLRQETAQGTVTHILFPGAILEYGDRIAGVNLLKNNPNQHSEINFNNSIENLEFELSSVIDGLINVERFNIGFLTGHGELNDYETTDFTKSLLDRYTLSKRSCRELMSSSPICKLLIVANPVEPFNESDKFYLDQYLMNGGRILLLIDPVSVSLDSLSNGFNTFAFPRNLNLDDLLFKYGVRINANLVQDVECLMIPVNTAPMGSPAKFTPAPWYYSPLLQPSPQHVIGKNINRVKSEFVSSIDTVGKSLKVKKTVILATSKASLISQTPLEVSLESINHPPDRRLFNQTSQTVGILLEGTFSSVFKNRMTTSFGMNTAEIKAESETTKMIVIADGNLMANKYRMTNGKFETMELGYDQFSKQTFGNKAFLLNSVHYLCDDKGLMALRANDFKIRLLDKVKWREEKFQWQLLNMVLPLLLIGLLGIAYVYVRKRIYNS